MTSPAPRRLLSPQKERKDFEFNFSGNIVHPTMSNLQESSASGRWQDGGEDSSSIEVLDLALGVVTTSDAQLRFNQDDIYIARETAVLVRCSLVDCVHGKLSLENPVPCTLLVFDFQLDRIKASRVIHSAIITLVTKGIDRIIDIAPLNRLNADSMELQLDETHGIEGEIGVDKGVKISVTPQTSTTTRSTKIKYATAKGWTSHYPRVRANDPSSHNCIKWSIQENPAKRDEGVPPHFRAAILLERHGDDEFQLEMEIDTTADLLTGLEDLRLKSVKMGRLTINPTKPSTFRLKKYEAELGKEDLSKITRLSLGTLDDRLFG